jgi:hypothetical protein
VNGELFEPITNADRARMARQAAADLRPLLAEVGPGSTWRKSLAKNMAELLRRAERFEGLARLEGKP